MRVEGVLCGLVVLRVQAEGFKGVFGKELSEVWEKVNKMGLNRLYRRNQVKYLTGKRDIRLKDFPELAETVQKKEKAVKEIVRLQNEERERR